VLVLEVREIMEGAFHSTLQAAFLLPVITRMLQEGVQGGSQAEQQSPQVLIISPARERTLQIYGEARKFVHGSIYRPVVVYGGTSVGHQLRQLEAGCNILVSTPGRLVDFLNRKKVSS
jgi:probable ATP-dependent RNA helicase DDX4